MTIEFLEKWRSSDLILAVSQIHVAEIAEHNSEKIRNSRYAFLTNLLPIQFEAGSFYEKEILAVLKRKQLVDIKADLGVFSTTITTINELRELQEFGNRRDILDTFRLMAKAQEFSWEAEKYRDRPKDGKKRRLGDIPNDDSFNSNFDDLREVMIGFKEQIKEEFSEEIGHNLDESFANIISIVDEFSKKAKNDGYLSSISELFGIDLNDPKSGSTPVENILDNYKFNAYAQQTAANQVKIPIELILGNVGLRDCPGLWLAAELRKDLSKAGDVSPSNEYDLEHIQYLPYVDLFFSDKRVVDKVTKILKRKDLLLELKGVPKPIKISNTLESLISTLFPHS